MGTARYKGDPTAPIDKELIKTVVLAINTGYYHIDGAEGSSPNPPKNPQILTPPVYGNEAEMGQAIKDSGLPRSKFYITTKISGTKVQDTLASFERSLKLLQVDYVDQYLIHAPFFASSPADLQAKWAELEKIQASGKAKTIGVSNFLQPDLEAILETAKVVPAINQIEYHPYLQHGDLLAFHKKHGIATAAYGPLSAVTKAKPGPLDPVYAKLSEKYKVTPGEVALRWVIDQDIVALTTSASEERLKQYLKIAGFELTKEEVEEITKVGKEKHYRGFWLDKFGPDDTR